MATIKKMMKAQNGDMVSKIKLSNKNSKSTDRKTGMNFDKKSFDKLPSYEDKIKADSAKKKAKSGGSFPDLNKDGKITKADILKGRGVIAKSGTKMKKTGMHKMPDGKMMKNSKMKPKANYGKSMMSKGGKMKMGGKCKNGC